MTHAGPKHEGSLHTDRRKVPRQRGNDVPTLGTRDLKSQENCQKALGFINLWENVLSGRWIMSSIQAKHRKNSRRGSADALIMEHIILNRRKLGTIKLVFLGTHFLRTRLV